MFFPSYENLTFEKKQCVLNNGHIKMLIRHIRNSTLRHCPQNFTCEFDTGEETDRSKTPALFPINEIKNNTCERNTLALNMLQHGVMRLVRKRGRSNSIGKQEHYRKSPCEICKFLLISWAAISFECSECVAKYTYKGQSRGKQGFDLRNNGCQWKTVAKTRIRFRSNSTATGKVHVIYTKFL